MAHPNSALDFNIREARPTTCLSMTRDWLVHTCDSCRRHLVATAHQVHAWTLAPPCKHLLEPIWRRALRPPCRYTLSCYEWLTDSGLERSSFTDSIIVRGLRRGLRFLGELLECLFTPVRRVCRSALDWLGRHIGRVVDGLGRCSRCVWRALDWAFTDSLCASCVRNVYWALRRGLDRYVARPARCCFDFLYRCTTTLGRGCKLYLLQPLGRALWRCVLPPLRWVGRTVSNGWSVLASIGDQLWLRWRRYRRAGLVVGDYVLNVPQGQLVQRRKGNFLVLENNTTYKLRLENDHAVSCNCHVWVDGHSIGAFRLQPWSMYTIQRPAARRERFCFVQETTKLAVGAVDDATGITTGAAQNGRVTARFVPCIPKDSRSRTGPEDTTSENVQVYVPNLAIKLQLWDTAGQERFYVAMNHYFYRGADALVLCVDLSDRSCLDYALGRHRQATEYLNQIQRRPVWVLVGCKNDKTPLQFDEAEMERLASGLNMPYFSTSAKTGDGVDAPFDFIQKNTTKVMSLPSGSDELLIPTLILKVVFLGYLGVGKTSLARRYSQDVFAADVFTTIDTDFTIKTVASGEAWVKVAPKAQGLGSNVREGGVRELLALGQSDAVRVSSLRRRKGPRVAWGESEEEKKQEAQQDEEEDKEEFDGTAQGATAFRGHTDQKYKYAESLQEDPTKAVTVELTMLLRRQYEHQIKLERVLLQDLRYPKAASNLIGECTDRQLVKLPDRENDSHPCPVFGN
eukprot:g27105.t1